MRTKVIEFNVGARYRKFRGVERRFDTVALARLVNSQAVQERVKNRDMHGYLGHWVREQYGMEPPESVIHQGKVVPLEPALITVLLEADPDGTIRHEAEFLDTTTGKSAARMWAAKVGGFSSAIDLADRDDIDFPLACYGFDYVGEPNFSSNRGYALDSAAGSNAGRRALDAVVAEHQIIVAALDSAYTSLQDQVAAQLLQATEALNHAVEERELLIGLLAKRPDAQQLRAALDAAHSFRRPGRAPIGVSSGGFEEALALSATIQLAGFAPMPTQGEEQDTQARSIGAKIIGAAAKVVRRG